MKTLGVNAIQRQVMHYLRSGDWKSVAELPVSASLGTLKGICEKGWIERRGGGPRSEIKLTPSGLLALKAKIQ